MEEKYSYPVKYISPIQLSDETLVQLRPIHPIDGAQAHDFKEKLSPQSIYDRFLGYIPKISEKLIKRLTQIDYEKEMAIVAEVEQNDHKEIIAIARIASVVATETEFAIIIADDWQGKGLGTILTDYMIDVARDMGFQKMYALVFSHNVQMLEILRQRGFELNPEGENTINAALAFKK